MLHRYSDQLQDLMRLHEALQHFDAGKHQQKVPSGTSRTSGRFICTTTRPFNCQCECVLTALGRGRCMWAWSCLSYWRRFQGVGESDSEFFFSASIFDNYLKHVAITTALPSCVLVPPYRTVLVQSGASGPLPDPHRADEAGSDGGSEAPFYSPGLHGNQDGPPPLTCRGFDPIREPGCERHM